MRKKYIVIAFISKDPSSSKQLLLSIKDSLNPTNFEIDCIVFANNENYKYPMETIFGKKITYLPLEENSSLNTAKARTYLQTKVYDYCKERAIKPVVWLLDEDMMIDKEANSYLSKLHDSKNEYDVVVGAIKGDTPNASFSGINTQLIDLIKNLEFLDTLNDDDVFPNLKHHNQVLRNKYPDYYYDLSSHHTGHLSEFFYIEPLRKGEKVQEVRARIYYYLDNILAGQNIFRPIVQKKLHVYKDTLLRGGNTFILNIETLKVNNPSIIVNDYTVRRSEMLWALINKKFLKKKIIKADFTVIHKRLFDIEKESSIEKTIQENSGSIIFNALRIYYYENSENLDFSSILTQEANNKKNAIKRNFEMIQKNIKYLENLNNSNLELFIKKLKNIYKKDKIDIILKDIDNLIKYDKEIFHQFISYKPLILGTSTLERLDGNLIQYDIGNEDIKIVTKTHLDDIPKDKPVAVRLHSSCCNSEVFDAIDCDCKSQLQESMREICKIDNGILFYLTQEGRGHGYGNKIAITGNMYTKGLNTYESCDFLGFERDIRNYSQVANILKKLEINKVEISSNNPRKVEDLEKNGIQVSRRDRKLITFYTHENIDYLRSKETQGGHYSLMLDEEALLKRFSPLENIVEFYEKFNSYGGFSNFADYPFCLENRYWRTSEHYYQANKFKRNSLTFNKIQKAKTPAKAKDIAYANHTDYENWEQRKILFMHNALVEKFRQNDELLQELLDTKQAYIVEKSVDDYYWGSGKDDTGKNILGRLLMYVREELRSS